MCVTRIANILNDIKDIWAVNVTFGNTPLNLRAGTVSCGQNPVLAYDAATTGKSIVEVTRDCEWIVLD